MRAGILRHVIELQAPNGSQGATGERVESWVTQATVRANIEPLRVAEQFAAAQLQTSITHRIQLRYDPGIAIDASWRVVYGSRIFSIVGPPRNIGERDRDIELLCVEGLRET